MIVKLIDFAGGYIKDINPGMSTQFFYNNPKR